MSDEAKRISRTAALKLIDEPQKFGRSLGCVSCKDLNVCGGLHTAQALFDCAELCQCDDDATKLKCQRTCPHNLPMFSKRHNEVSGWNLEVENTEVVVTPELPCYVPIIKDGSKRIHRLQHPTVGLRLDTLISGNWEEKCSSRDRLADRFKIASDASIVINGIGFDGPLERYWKHRDRASIAMCLSSLQPIMMSTPNFSLFTDVPRWENLYNMKRIALIWHELADAGIPTALHLNARTVKDWERWRDFLAVHPEIRLVSFEFGSGANGKRRDWYVAQLKQLADRALQPLALILRGGVSSIRSLSESFDQISLLSMNAFMKTINRRCLYTFGGRLRDRKAPTKRGTSIDDLLVENVLTEQSFIMSCLGREQNVQRSKIRRAG